jgi:hypothetical protein
MLGLLPLYLKARVSGQVGEGNQVQLDNILRGGLFGHGSKETKTLQNHRYPYLCSSDGLIELIYKLENQLGIILK